MLLPKLTIILDSLKPVEKLQVSYISPNKILLHLMWIFVGSVRIVKGCRAVGKW